MTTLKCWLINIWCTSTHILLLLVVVVVKIKGRVALRDLIVSAPMRGKNSYRSSGSLQQDIVSCCMRNDHYGCSNFNGV